MKWILSLDCSFAWGRGKQIESQTIWKTGRLFNLKCFSENMSRDRFLIILRCLHFAPNPDEGEVTEDTLYKLT